MPIAGGQEYMPDGYFWASGIRFWASGSGSAGDVLLCWFDQSDKRAVDMGQSSSPQEGDYPMQALKSVTCSSMPG
jgi:hypothetical protein